MANVPSYQGPERHEKSPKPSEEKVQDAVGSEPNNSPRIASIHGIPGNENSLDETLDLADFKNKRKAVVHTVEISPIYSQHAQQVVRGFRRGLYGSEVEFHIGDVGNWIDEQNAYRGLAQRPPEERTFLSHAILDMPGSHAHLKKVSEVLHVDGKLIVFSPSVTQIGNCVQLIKNERLPLILDRVLEVGQAMTGGRHWDLRMVVPRVLMKKTEAEVEASFAGDQTSQEKTERTMQVPEDLEAVTSIDDQTKVLEKAEMVCRPRTGDRTAGVGFVGVWRKMRC